MVPRGASVSGFWASWGTAIVPLRAGRLAVGVHRHHVPGERGTRPSWIVSKEGTGLDFALEVIVLGARRKDQKRKVEE